jgi:hypothetical protein
MPRHPWIRFFSRKLPLGNQTAGEQFPSAWQRRIERPVLVARIDQEAGAKRSCRKAENIYVPPLRCRDQQQRQRPEDVELLLDAERP